MTSTVSVFLLFLLACFLAVAIATDGTSIESPEPNPEDPMMPGQGITLYLSTAGKLPLTETRLTPSSEVKVCPDDFPTGWTVRCDVTTQESVVFRINGVIYMKEYKAPFYLAGNWRDQAGDFQKEGASVLARSTRLRISCSARMMKEVYVDFTVEC